MTIPHIKPGFLEIDYTIYRGVDWLQKTTYKDKDKNLIPLTGYSARMKIKSGTDDTLLISLTEVADGNGDLVALGGAAGTVTYTIADTTSEAWTPGTYKYDCELIDVAGLVIPFQKGKIYVVKEVTD